MTLYSFFEAWMYRVVLGERRVPTICIINESLKKQIIAEFCISVYEGLIEFKRVYEVLLFVYEIRISRSVAVKILSGSGTKYYLITFISEWMITAAMYVLNYLKN